MATNFEKLLAMNKHSISTIFCGLVDGCGQCKMAKRCQVGGNGFLDWMNDVNGFSEITEEQEDHELAREKMADRKQEDAE